MESSGMWLYFRERFILIKICSYEVLNFFYVLCFSGEEGHEDTCSRQEDVEVHATGWIPLRGVTGGTACTPRSLLPEESGPRAS